MDSRLFPGFLLISGVRCDGGGPAWLGRPRDSPFGCTSELHGKDPGGLLIGTGIPGPADEIQQLAVTAVLIDLRVEDLGDLKLRLAIYEDRQGWQLYFVGDRVRGCRFQHRDVEHQVDGVEVVR